MWSRKDLIKWPIHPFFSLEQLEQLHWLFRRTRTLKLSAFFSFMQKDNNETFSALEGC